MPKRAWRMSMNFLKRETDVIIVAATLAPLLLSVAVIYLLAAFYWTDRSNFDPPNQQVARRWPARP